MSLFSPPPSDLPSTPSCNEPDIIMTETEGSHEASGDTPTKKSSNSDTPNSRLKDADPIAPDGDIILYIPGKKPDETDTNSTTATEDVSFLVSSAHLRLSSEYFKALLSARWSK
ncbi:unnamed protein product [Penicillium bialowiezense]